MEALKEILSNHPVFKELSSDHIAYLSDCAHLAEYAGGTLIFKTGEPAEEFFLIKSGKVALEVFSPPKGPLTIQTVGENNLLGWSWLYPPYSWHFEARAMADTTAYAFDAIKIRRRCKEDYEFGYILTNCIGQIMMQRLAATRLQLLDVYGTDSGYPNYMD